MWATLMPFRRFCLFNNILTKPTSRCDIEQRKTVVKLGAVNRLCTYANCHIKDTMWEYNPGKLPENRTYEPLYRILDERGIQLGALCKKVRKEGGLYAYHHRKENSFSDYDIYCFAFLLDVEPDDLVEVVDDNDNAVENGDEGNGDNS